MTIPDIRCPPFCRDFLTKFRGLPVLVEGVPRVLVLLVGRFGSSDGGLLMQSWLFGSSWWLLAVVVISLSISPCWPLLLLLISWAYLWISQYSSDQNLQPFGIWHIHCLAPDTLICLWSSKTNWFQGHKGTVSEFPYKFSLSLLKGTRNAKIKTLNGCQN